MIILVIYAPCYNIREEKDTLWREFERISRGIDLEKFTVIGDTIGWI